MQSTTLEKWFPKATKSGRNHLTVPPCITELSCGHTREVSDPVPFYIRKSKEGWRHCTVINSGVPDCGAVLDLPFVDVPPTFSLLTRRGKENVKEFSRHFFGDVGRR